MQKLTTPLDIYVEGSKEKGAMYKQQLKDLGYHVEIYFDFTDEDRVFFNYPGTFKMFDTTKKNVKEVVRKLATHLENVAPRFQPYDKVLGLSNIGDKRIWLADFYSHYEPLKNRHVCVGYTYERVIPYEGNENKLGKTEKAEGECDEMLPF